MVENPRTPADWQPRFARVVLAGSLFLGLLVLAPDVYFGLGSAAMLIVLVLYLAAGAIVLARGSYNLQVASSMTLLAAAAISASFGGSAPSNGTFFILALITVATLLWSPAAGAAATGISLIVASLGAVLAATAATPPTPGLAGWIGLALAVLLFGLALVFGIRYLRHQPSNARTLSLTPPSVDQGQRSANEESLAQHGEALDKALEVGRIVSGIHDPKELADRIPRLVAQRFSCREVILYLVNEQGDQAIASGVSGESVELLPEGKQVVALDSESPIAQTIRAGIIRLSSEGDGALAVPLILGNRVLGALDLVPDDARTAGSQDLDAIQALASQVAVVLDNARAFQETERRLSHFGGPSPQANPTPWNPFAESPRLEYEVGRPATPGGADEIRVPLSLRDETIGTISLAADTDWSDEQRHLVEAVATQAALALENARLVEASQLAARREHTLAEITGQVWASPTVEGILRTAVEELGKALGAEQAVIELKTEDNDDSS